MTCARPPGARSPRNAAGFWSAPTRAAKNGAPMPPSDVHVVLPAPVIDQGNLQGSCLLLKLHGSVDWEKNRSDNGDVFVTSSKARPEAALECGANQLAIATPGPSKAREAKGFKSIWDLAKDALKQADAIVFIGFRFPETDADAREELLGAIRENNEDADMHHLSLHVVLGLPSPQSQRLEAMLRFAVDNRRDNAFPHVGGGRSYLLNSHPLFAQDFLALVHREKLFLKDSPR
jgi:hypothetical protein